MEQRKEVFCGMRRRFLDVVKDCDGTFDGLPCDYYRWCREDAGLGPVGSEEKVEDEKVLEPVPDKKSEKWRWTEKK